MNFTGSDAGFFIDMSVSWVMGSCLMSQFLRQWLAHVLMYYHAGSSHLKMRDAHGLQQYSSSLWHSSNDWLVLTGPKCAKKISPTPFPHRHQPGLLKWGTLGPWIHAVAAKLCPYHLYASAEINILQTTLRFSGFQLSTAVGTSVSLCPLQPRLSVLGWQKWNLMGSSTVVAHLPLTCWEF